MHLTDNEKRKNVICDKSIFEFGNIQHIKCYFENKQNISRFKDIKIILH